MLRMERLAWLAAAGVLGLMAQPPARGGRGGAGGGRGGGEYLPYYQAPVVKGGPVGRTPEGKPDLQGYWTSRFNQSVYDIEDHPVARPGIPAGKGSIVDPPGGKIPYQPWAADKARDSASIICISSPKPTAIFPVSRMRITAPSVSRSSRPRATLSCCGKPAMRIASFPPTAVPTSIPNTSSSRAIPSAAGKATRW